MPHLRIHHADALRDVLHRRLQQLAAEAQFLRGLIEQFGDLVDVQALALERMRQHDARRGGADRAGQHALEVLQQAAIGGLRRASAVRGRVCAAYSCSAWRAAAAPMMRAATVSRSPTLEVMACRPSRGALGRDEGARGESLLQRHAAARRHDQHHQTFSVSASSARGTRRAPETRHSSRASAMRHAAPPAARLGRNSR